ncbi:MAG TPA: hypothetical protein VNX61_08755 [Rhizomicrobium sp.]|nr:hypothetical protein [Rhizomicrobium sp.]
MAAKLTEFYAQAAKQYGVMGRMRLAMLTKISSEKAGAEVDSPENIKLFEQAMLQLKVA